MITRFRLIAAAVLLVLSALVSGLLLLQHHGEPRAMATVSQVCGAGADSGCETVAHSRFAAVGGVPLAAIGVAFAASLAALLLLASFAGPEAQYAPAVVALVALGAALAIDVVLLGLQALVIHAFCRLCLATYALNALAFLAVWPAWKLRAGAAAGVRTHDGQLVWTGWLLATLTLVAGIFSAEVALHARERGRVFSMLGTPSAPSAAASAPLPLPSGDPAAQLQAALARAQSLQETLDDPQKLDRYFADKAQREYDAAAPQTFDLKTGPVRGNPEGPVHTVEFSDFLCPFCRGLAGAFEAFLPQSGNRVAIHFKNYPLESTCNTNITRTVHQGACVVALGGVCANQQGKFWQYHDKVFSAPPTNPTADDVARIATEAGLDGTALHACLESSAAKDQLTREIKEGAAAGVNATPTVYLNGKKLPRINDFIVMVEKETAKLGLPPLTPAPPPAR